MVCKVLYYKNFRGGLVSTPVNLTVLSNIEFCPLDDVVLIFRIQLAEVSAPAPYTDNEVGIVLRMCLSIQQTIPIDGIELKLVAAAKNKELDKLCHFAFTLRIAEHIVVHFHSQGTAVDDLAQIKLGK